MDDYLRSRDLERLEHKAPSRRERVATELYARLLSHALDRPTLGQEVMGKNQDKRDKVLNKLAEVALAGAEVLLGLVKETPAAQAQDAGAVRPSAPANPEANVLPNLGAGEVGDGAEAGRPDQTADAAGA
jgi:hypothetical protein